MPCTALCHTFAGQPAHSSHTLLAVHTRQLSLTHCSMQCYGHLESLQLWHMHVQVHGQAALLLTSTMFLQDTHLQRPCQLLPVEGVGSGGQQAALHQAVILSIVLHVAGLVHTRSAHAEHLLQSITTLAVATSAPWKEVRKAATVHVAGVARLKVAAGYKGIGCSGGPRVSSCCFQADADVVVKAGLSRPATNTVCTRVDSSGSNGGRRPRRCGMSHECVCSAAQQYCCCHTRQIAHHSPFRLDAAADGPSIHLR
jgi:hypothetical protein